MKSNTTIPNTNNNDRNNLQNKNQSIIVNNKNNDLLKPSGTYLKSPIKINQIVDNNNIIHQKQLLNIPKGSNLNQDDNDIDDDYDQLVDQDPQDFIQFQDTNQFTFQAYNRTSNQNSLKQQNNDSNLNYLNSDKNNFERENQEQNQIQKNIRMPQPFYKAKKTLTKLITQYFNQFKQEYLRQSIRNIGGQNSFSAKQVIFNFQAIQNVKKAIHQLIKMKPSAFDLKTRKKTIIDPSTLYEDSIFPKSVAVTKFQKDLKPKLELLNQNIQSATIGNNPKTEIVTKKQEVQNYYKEKLIQLPNKLYYYLSQPGNQKLCEYSTRGKPKIIELNSLIKQQEKKQKQVNKLRPKFGLIKSKFPNWATPITLKNYVYLLDPSDYNSQKCVYQPLNEKRFKIKIPKNCDQSYSCQRLQAKTQYQKIKSALVSDNSRYIYMLGGLATKHKIPTKQCQRYDTLKDKFQYIPKLNEIHPYLNTCIIKKKLIVFSQIGLQVLNLNCLKNQSEYEQDQTENNANWANGHLKWSFYKTPYNAQFYAFQFSHPISQNQIIIFGGVFDNKKQQTVQILNVPTNPQQAILANQSFFTHFTIENLGQVLPQPICVERCSQPILFANSIGVIGSIQGSIFSKVTVKNQILQVIYTNQSQSILEKLINIQQAIRDKQEQKGVKSHKK